MNKAVILAAAALLLGTSPAEAVVIRVDYSPLVLAEATCTFSVGCAEALSGLPVEALGSVGLIFELDDAQRAVAGSYDVSTAVGGSLIDAFMAAAAGATSSSVAATAVVSGGLVSDLSLNFAYSATLESVVLQASITGGGGGYSATTSTSLLGDFSGTLQAVYHGTYGITQPPVLEPPPVTLVPEPSTWLLLTGGVAMAFVARRRSRRS